MSYRRGIVIAGAIGLAANVPLALGLGLGSGTADAAAPDTAKALHAPLGRHLTVTAQMRAVERRLARRRAARRRKAASQDVSMPPLLAKIAECESHMNPRSIGGGGAYRGMFQFSESTWQSVGGHGDPAAASIAEQVKRAKILLAQAGPSQWPVCSR